MMASIGIHRWRRKKFASKVLPLHVPGFSWVQKMGGLEKSSCVFKGVAFFPHPKNHGISKLGFGDPEPCYTHPNPSFCRVQWFLGQFFVECWFHLIFLVPTHLIGWMLQMDVLNDLWYLKKIVLIHRVSIPSAQKPKNHHGNQALLGGSSQLVSG